MTPERALTIGILAIILLAIVLVLFGDVNIGTR